MGLLSLVLLLIGLIMLAFGGFIYPLLSGGYHPGSGYWKVMLVALGLGVALYAPGYWLSDDYGKNVLTENGMFVFVLVISYLVDFSGICYGVYTILVSAIKRKKKTKENRQRENFLIELSKIEESRKRIIHLKDKHKIVTSVVSLVDSCANDNLLRSALNKKFESEEITGIDGKRYAVTDIDSYLNILNDKERKINGDLNMLSK